MLRIFVKTKLISVITELQTKKRREEIFHSSIMSKSCFGIVSVSHIFMYIKYIDMLFSIIRPNFLEKNTFS